MTTQPLLSLSCHGDWSLRSAEPHLGKSIQCPAVVPGCVHTDLLAVHAFPDPWFRDQEKDLRFVETLGWVYSRTIDVPAELLEREHVTLVCEGLDTLATVRINGQTVGSADNMFRTWRFDVKRVLRAGHNELEVAFDSPLPLMKQRQAQRPLPAWNRFHADYAGKSYVRKMACAFGWDWGLMAPTAGLWKPMALVGFDTRLADVRITQRHTANAVTLDLQAHTQASAAHANTTRVRWSLSLDNQTIATIEAPVAQHSARASMPICSSDQARVSGSSSGATSRMPARSRICSASSQCDRARSAEPASA